MRVLIRHKFTCIGMDRNIFQNQAINNAIFSSFFFIQLQDFEAGRWIDVVINLTLSTYKSISMESFLYQLYVHIVCTFLVWPQLYRVCLYYKSNNFQLLFIVFYFSDSTMHYIERSFWEIHSMSLRNLPNYSQQAHFSD